MSKAKAAAPKLSDEEIAAIPVTLTVPLGSANYLLRALGKFPIEEAGPLFELIQGQAQRSVNDYVTSKSEPKPKAPRAKAPKRAPKKGA